MANTFSRSTIFSNASAGPEDSIRLSNSSWCRKLDFGTAWTHLRVGVRLHYVHVPTSGNNISWTGDGVTNPEFGVGLCSGNAPVRKNSGAHWCGSITQGTWLDTDQGIQDYLMGINNVYAAKKVNGTRTLSGAVLRAVSGLGGSAINTVNFHRCMWFIDIFKGAPNFSFRLFCPTSPQNNDITRASFMTQMETLTPAFADHVYTAAQTVAVDEGTDGVFDSVNCFWDRSGPEIHLCDVALCRFA